MTTVFALKAMQFDFQDALLPADWRHMKPSDFLSFIDNLPTSAFGTSKCSFRHFRLEQNSIAEIGST
jgi:hypothetical protein